MLKGVSLNVKISEIMNRNPIKIYTTWNDEEVRKYLESPKVVNKFSLYKPLIVPVVDENEKIVGLRTVYKEIREGTGIYRIKPTKTRPWIPKKVLVIGGAGYIGSVLVQMLLKEGFKVKVMDKLLYGDHGIRELYENKNFEFFKGDITSIDDILEAMKDVDAVVHLAGIVGDPASKTKPEDTLKINYFSTRALSDIAKYLGISKFIFASSCSVYGFREEVCTEETDTNPLSLYAETKLMSEKALLEEKGNGFCPVILRFATAYGLSPRMRFDLVVNLLTAKAIFDKVITVFGEGRQYRPFAHIRDISRAIIAILKAPVDKVCGEIFNVGSDEQNLSIKELAEKIKSRYPEAELKFVKEKEDNRSYRVSFRKIKERLGFTAEYTIEYAVDEIKQAVEKGLITDYKDKKYSNYKSLAEGP